MYERGLAAGALDVKLVGGMLKNGSSINDVDLLYEFDPSEVPLRHEVERQDDTNDELEDYINYVTAGVVELKERLRELNFRTDDDAESADIWIKVGNEHYHMIIDTMGRQYLEGTQIGIGKRAVSIRDLPLMIRAEKYYGLFTEKKNTWQKNYCLK